MKINERGVTLVELLVAIALTTIIGIIGYNILFSGMSAYEQAKVKTELRDEADIVMTNILNELHKIKLSDIDKTVFEGEHYYFVVDGKKIGFENNVAFALDRKIVLNKDIELSAATIEGLDIVNGEYDYDNMEQNEYIENLYEITIVLEKVGTDEQLETQSRFSIINDSREGDR